MLGLGGFGSVGLRKVYLTHFQNKQENMRGLRKKHLLRGNSGFLQLQ